MGMVLVLKKASARDIESLHQSPELILRFTGCDEGAPDDGPRDGGLLARLFPFFKKPKASEVVFDQADAEEFDVDKAWHGLYFMLTGSAYDGPAPASYLLNGKGIGNIEVGYGPAWSISPPQVSELHAYLNSLTDADFLAGFDPKRMTEHEIYPSIWDRDPEEEQLQDFVLDAFHDLKAYCAEAAAAKLGLVGYIS